jgi:hypothetical protein
MRLAVDWCKMRSKSEGMSVALKRAQEESSKGPVRVEQDGR